jgi:hypothetical protein
MNFQKDHAPPGIYEVTCTIPESASYTFTGAHTFQSKLPDLFAIRFFLEHGA